LYKKSPRYLDRETARSLISNSPNGIKKVGLVVDPTNDFLDAISDIDLDMLQLHGSETLERVNEIKSKVNFSLIKAVGVNDKKDLELVEKYAEIADQILIDAKPNYNSLPGGNGVKFDWKILEDITWEFPWFLAGGLNESNIDDALFATNAKKVDLSSGVEDSHGKKSIVKINNFVKKIRKYEENLNVG
ncbi:MAG: phosphoribosylanthranilate isomerase, partial [Rhodobacterales bacterium]